MLADSREISGKAFALTAKASASKGNPDALSECAAEAPALYSALEVAVDKLWDWIGSSPEKRMREKAAADECHFAKCELLPLFRNIRPQKTSLEEKENA